MVFTITNNGNRVDITNNNLNERKPKLWKQFTLSFLASLPFFTHGVETTALSSSAHAGHFVVTSGDVPWSTTGLILAAVASAPIYCYLVDNYGRRSGLYVINLVQGASCIPLFLDGTEFSIIILHVFAGISLGGLFTILPTFIREISDDSIRGVTVSLMMVMTTAGYLVYLAIDLEAMMFLMVALVAAQFLAMLLMVETPSYLVKRGKIELAKISLAKLTCTDENDPNVQRELDTLKEESDRATANGNITLWRIIKNPIYRDLIKIGVVLNTTTVLCGSIAFLDQQKTLVQLKMALDEKTLVLACLVSGSVVAMLMIKFMERNHVLSIAYTIMVFSIGILAVYTQNDLTILTMRLLPVSCFGTLVFAYGIVWGLPLVVMVEMLNFQIRCKMISALFIYSQLLKLAHIHTFKYIEEYMGIYTIFYIFATVNMFGAVYSLFLLPFIKDKNVKQIERQMKRVPLLKFSNRPIKV